jgi:D-alanyl-D-alanine carboxypeptidase
MYFIDAAGGFNLFVFHPVRVSRLVDQATDALRKAASSPAAVMRVDYGNLSVGAASGVADIVSKAPALVDSRFEVASQTKMMTAVIALQLEAEGKLALDAPISAYLDATTLAGIANADTATVRQLLDMTAGILNYTAVSDRSGGTALMTRLLSSPTAEVTVADALDIVRNKPAAAAPGTFQYSDTNYALLGLIFEQILQKPLSEIFEQRIFAPLGMGTSDLEGVVHSGDGLHGYGVGADNTLIDLTFARLDDSTAGGVVSTTADMVAFLRALLVEKTLLDDVQLAKMQDYAVVGSGSAQTTRFGLGLFELAFAGQDALSGFSGGSVGHSSSTYLSRETGAIISLDVSKAGSSVGVGAIRTIIDTIKSDALWQGIPAFDAASDTLLVKAVSARALSVSGDQELRLAYQNAELSLPVDLRRVTTSNVTLADGSVLVVGDNSVGASADDVASVINIARQFSGAANDDNQLLGLGGDDWMAGANGNDKLHGGDGDDILRGRGGDDVLLGSAGADRLVGGAGDDRFVFDDLRSSGTLARDVIRDFQPGDDRIVLRAIDANANRAGDQAFKFIGDDAFSGKAGQLRYKHDTDVTIVAGDVDGDRIADFKIEVKGLHDLLATDFIF